MAEGNKRKKSYESIVMLNIQRGVDKFQGFFILGNANFNWCVAKENGYEGAKG